MKTLVPLLLLGSIAAGCVSRQSAPEAAGGEVSALGSSAEIKTLAGTRWTVIALDGNPVERAPDGWPAQSLEFDPDGGRVSGHAGVNRFAGRCEQDGGALRFGPLAMTRRAGPPAQMESERRYTVVLSAVTGWRQDGPNLVLVTPAHPRAAVLAPAPAKAE